MKKGLLYILLLAFVVLTSCNSGKEVNQVKQVEIRKNESGHHRFFVNNEEFYVMGAGPATSTILSIKENGGNAFRTWNTFHGEYDAPELLDIAEENGLMVLMCLGIASERHGFDYEDTAKVREQFEYAKTEVMRLKDHPALLAWAIGNELNHGVKSLQVYKAVNEISKMIHEIDGNHPTTSTFSLITREEVDYINEHCPDLDFISIQAYAAIEVLDRIIDESGWEGPYLVTEWGATGHWEVGRTEWDVAIEPSSKQKAESFIRRYNNAIASDKENCMGSFVFYWGQKQERTPTWYGTFLENGNKTETVDAMHYIWNGKWPENRSPSLDSFKINNQTADKNIRLTSGQRFQAQVYTTEYENDALTYHWEIIPESSDLGEGGDFEERPETILSIDGEDKIDLAVPNEAGAYRLFVYVSDPYKQSATANIPFMVIKE